MLIPNALQPAEVEDVILCPMLGRVIVLVRDDQLSLAIGKKGQNVRLASKLVGWDIEVMTREELDEQLDRSVTAFANVPHVSDELAEALVSQGFFSYEDLSVIEPDQLLELSGLTQEQCDEIVEYADAESLREEQEANARRAVERAERASAQMAEQVAAAQEAQDQRSDGATSSETTSEPVAADAGQAETAAEENEANEAEGEVAVLTDETADTDEEPNVVEEPETAAEVSEDASGPPSGEAPADVETFQDNGEESPIVDAIEPEEAESRES